MADTKKYWVIVKKTSYQYIRVPVIASYNKEAEDLALAKAKKINFNKAHCREKSPDPMYDVTGIEIAD